MSTTSYMEHRLSTSIMKQRQRSRRVIQSHDMEAQPDATGSRGRGRIDRRSSDTLTHNQQELDRVAIIERPLHLERAGPGARELLAGGTVTTKVLELLEDGSTVPASESIISVWQWVLEDEEGLMSGPALKAAHEAMPWLRQTWESASAASGAFIPFTDAQGDRRLRLRRPNGSFDPEWLKLFLIRGRQDDRAYKISGLVLLLAAAFRVSPRYTETVLSHVRSGGINAGPLPSSSFPELDMGGSRSLSWGVYFLESPNHHYIVGATANGFGCRLGGWQYTSTIQCREHMSWPDQRVGRVDRVLFDVASALPLERDKIARMIIWSLETLGIVTLGSLHCSDDSSSCGMNINLYDNSPHRLALSAGTILKAWDTWRGKFTDGPNGLLLMPPRPHREGKAVKGPPSLDLRLNAQHAVIRFAQWRQHHFAGILPSHISDQRIYWLFAEIDRASRNGELKHFLPIPGGGLERIRMKSDERPSMFCRFVQSKDLSLSIAAGTAFGPSSSVNARVHRRSSPQTPIEATEDYVHPEDPGYGGAESEEWPSDVESD